ncbi:MAG: hypothetical protein LBC62_00760 [Treponema sp.]|jgi:hypothetical protein|nr:hypothetical protein [Treponema sp.]
MLRRRLLLLVFTFPLFLLPAQEEQPGTGAAGDFPVFALLEAADSGGGGTWQPDWPPDFPPDAFRLPEGQRASITVALGETQYRMDRNAAGALFPFLLDGKLVQVRAAYSGVSRISEAALEGASLKLEVLEYEDDKPSLVRVFRDDVYSFVLLRRRGAFVSESWYDEEGRALCFYEYRLSAGPDALITSTKRRSTDGDIVTLRHYDSRYLVTGINGPEGDFSVQYYRQDLPRYWERKPPVETSETRETGETAQAEPEKQFHYSLQWDEAGLLVRISGTAGDSGELVDSRYEYTLDERGNWIERREYRMDRNFGLLAASGGATVTRVLEYRDKE